MHDADLRQRLERIASRINVDPGTIDRMVTRGRRRRVRAVLASALTTVTVLTAFAWAAGAVVVGRPAPWVPGGAAASDARIGAPAPVPPARLATVETTEVGRYPTLMAPGPSWMWVTDSDIPSPSIYRVDPATGRVISSELLPGQPVGLVGAGPVAFVALDRQQGLFVTTGDVVDAARDGPRGVYPVGLAKGLDFVWTVNTNGTVSKIDTSTGQEVQRFNIGASELERSGLAIAIGSGHVWITGGYSGVVFAINPTDGRITKLHVDAPAREAGAKDSEFPFIGANLWQIFYTGDAIWVCCGTHHQLQRIDPLSMKVTDDVPGDVTCGEPIGGVPGLQGLWLLTQCSAGGAASVEFITVGVPSDKVPPEFAPAYRLGAYGYVAVSRRGAVPVADQQTVRAIAAAFGQVWVSYGDSNAGHGYLDRFPRDVRLKPIAFPASWWHRWRAVAAVAVGSIALGVFMLVLHRRRRIPRDLVGHTMYGPAAGPDELPSRD
jgi:hypothetical protein